jgi:hypothetical protein
MPSTIASALARAAEAAIVVCPAHLHVDDELARVDGLLVATPDGHGLQALLDRADSWGASCPLVVLGIDISGAQAQALMDTLGRLALRASVYVASLLPASDE